MIPWRSPLPPPVANTLLPGVSLEDVLAPEVKDFFLKYRGEQLKTSCQRESHHAKKKKPNHCLAKNANPLFLIMKDVINAREPKELNNYNIIPMAVFKNARQAHQNDRQAYRIIEKKKFLNPASKRGTQISLGVEIQVVFVGQVIGSVNPVPGTRLFHYITGISCKGGSKKGGSYCIKVGC